MTHIDEVFPVVVDGFLSFQCRFNLFANGCDTIFGSYKWLGTWGIVRLDLQTRNAPTVNE